MQLEHCEVGLSQFECWGSCARSNDKEISAFGFPCKSLSSDKGCWDTVTGSFNLHIAVIVWGCRSRACSRPWVLISWCKNKVKIEIFAIDLSTSSRAISDSRWDFSVGRLNSTRTIRISDLWTRAAAGAIVCEAPIIDCAELGKSVWVECLCDLWICKCNCVWSHGLGENVSLTVPDARIPICLIVIKSRGIWSGCWVCWIVCNTSGDKVVYCDWWCELWGYTSE